MKLKSLLLRRKAMTNLNSILKSTDISLPTKVHLVQIVVFLSSLVWMWALYYKESWALKNWCFWTVVLEKTLESLLGCKEIQPVNPTGNRCWIIIGRTYAEAETLKLCPPEAQNWLIGKDPDAGKDWRQEEKGTAEDEMVGWHHWLNGPEFFSKLQELVLRREAWHGAVLGSQCVKHDWVAELNWTKLKKVRYYHIEWWYLNNH